MTQALGDDTGWVKLGSALRVGARKLGVVCYGPDRNGMVTLLLEAALARPSEAELEASPWIAECGPVWAKVGSPALVKCDDGPKVGAVSEGPDMKGNVRPTWPNSSVSDPINAAVLARRHASKPLSAMTSEDWISVSNWPAPSGMLAATAPCATCFGHHLRQTA